MFLKLPTLKFRRIRGDIIEVFKILNGYYDFQNTPTLVRNLDTTTCGNSLKLVHLRPNLDVKNIPSAHVLLTLGTHCLIVSFCLAP